MVLWADSTHLYAALESLDTPGISAWIPLGVRQEHWSVPLECLRLLGGVNTDRVLAVNPFSLVYNFNRVAFTEVSTRSGATGVRDYTLHLPENMAARDVALSPRADRLAWVLVVRPAYSHLLALLQRAGWLGNLADVDPVIELCTSRLDGTDMKLIGRMPMNRKWNQDIPTDLRWLPGGKRVSFVCRKTFWTIAVEN